MKRLNFIIILILTFITQNVKGQEDIKRFGQNQIHEDLDYLYNALIDAHYNIYAYVNKEDFQNNYKNVKKSIVKDSLTLLEATNLFQKVTSAANNGHTEIDFPGASYGKYAYSGGTIFPLEIAFENNKSLVRKNFSSNPNIEIGTELVSINGISINDILTKIYPQISAERTYFKNAKIEMLSFPRLYWQVFGRQDMFEVEVLLNGKLTKYNLSSVHLIEAYEMKRTEIINAHMKLKFYENAAYLNPGNFSGNEQKYQQFIDSSFAVINKRGSDNLIIDFRNNGGGDNSFSDYLVSYIADKPFKWTSHFTIKSSKFLKEHTRKFSDTTAPYFKNILNHKDGEIYEPELDDYQPQEHSRRFSGNVYVLVNRQSHSQSTVAAAQIQDYGFGTIVGEETGEYPSLYASQFQYKLPNTGIPVKVSKGYITRINGSKKEEGVIPDIFIKDHLLDEDDEILNGLLNKLN
ncbi:S41 family peptidase [Aestuariibaculum sediminum]|uniref:Peptidase S41 n=1 Tax=Aestuariibaculum sediminum TaxID=2770637 RepID=A0A8J6Q1D9_9FLAO|nr:S41 family peptidase [Aestuariibaculum sediminum]MBD0831034.1 peptidase S41 [Aestuariibaculum sediminum]